MKKNPDVKKIQGISDIVVLFFFCMFIMGFVALVALFVVIVQFLFT